METAPPSGEKADMIMPLIKDSGSLSSDFLCCVADHWMYLFWPIHVASVGLRDEGIDTDLLIFLLPIVLAVCACICMRTAGWETLIVVYFLCFWPILGGQMYPF